LRDIVRILRRQVAGPLTVKTRLGRQTSEWRAILSDRLRLLENEGVDALIVHPRYAEEKFKRTARHSLLAELATITRLPIIANGDMTGPQFVSDHAAELAPASGLMIGRLVAAQPWFFAKWHQPDLIVDHQDVWKRLCAYIIEDFSPTQALARIKIITPYFARNFLFGHTFFTKVQSSPDIATLLARAAEFMADSPPLASRVSVDGI